MTKARKRSKAKSVCKKYGCDSMAEIIYGMPVYTPQFAEELASGKVALGGGEIGLGKPVWQCNKCMHQQ